MVIKFIMDDEGLRHYKVTVILNGYDLLDYVVYFLDDLVLRKSMDKPKAIKTW